MALASGYPRAMAVPSKALRASALRARVDQTLNIDSLVGRHDTAKLLEFARVYASRTAGVTPLASLCSEIGISRVTGRAYMGRRRRRPRLGCSAVDALAVVAGEGRGA